MNYFQTGDNMESLFPESLILKNGIKHQVLFSNQKLEKVIPSYITSSGWSLLFSRSRDGASYNT